MNTRRISGNRFLRREIDAELERAERTGLFEIFGPEETQIFEAAAATAPYNIEYIRKALRVRYRKQIAAAFKTPDEEQLADEDFLRDMGIRPCRLAYGKV